MRWWQSLFKGFSNTLGVAQVRRRIPTPAEEMDAVKVQIRAAIDESKLELLKTDPDEYFRQTRSPLLWVTYAERNKQ